MVNRHWRELDPRWRRALVVTGVVEGILKLAALVDIARRSPGDVRGSRAKWAVAVTLINSMGVVPILYFARGRSTSPSRTADCTTSRSGSVRDR